MSRSCRGLSLALIVAVVWACGSPGSRETSTPPAPEGAAGQPAKVEPHGGEEQAQAASGGGLPIPALGYNAREGRALYLYYCSKCHGDEGHGDGFNAYNLDPKPRDLADSAFQSKRTDEELRAVIHTGGGAAGLSTGMPPWGRTLNGRQIHNLVVYLRALGAADESR